MRHLRVTGAWLAAALLIVISVSLFGSASSGAGFTYIGYGEDPQGFIWFLNWWPFAWAHHLSLFHTRYVAAPAGMNLAWRTSIPALGFIAAPFTAMFGALSTYNWLMRLAPGLAGMGMFWAARELTGRTIPALVAGLIFGFSSYEMGQSLGHLNLNFTIAVPLLLWASLRSLRLRWPSAGLALAIGVLLAFQLCVSQEIAASAVLMAALSLGLIYRQQPEARAALRRLAPGLLGGLLVGGALASPLLIEMLFGGGGGSTSIAAPSASSTDLLNFIIPTPVTLPFGHMARGIAGTFRSNFSEEAGYLGLPLILLLAGIYLTTDDPEIRLPLTMALGAAVLSLGPVIHVAGHGVFPAPWQLVSWMPIVHDMLPQRFMIYADLMVALAVAAWLAKPVAGPIAPLRYALVAGALAFCIPNPAVVGHWSDVKLPRIFTASADHAALRGRTVLILPFQGNHIGEQYAAGMRFRMAAEGYLGGGIARPFSEWPLIMPLYNGEYGKIPRREFGVFLARYDVADILVETSQIRNPGAILSLVNGAGWHLDARVGSVEIFGPPAQPPSPSAVARETAAYLHARALATLARRERLNVCAIRRFERRWHVKLGPVWWLYRRSFTLPLKIGTISCNPAKAARM